MKIKQQRILRDRSHLNIFNKDVFHHASTSASALEAKADICA
jgi:hypothetical protein